MLTSLTVENWKSFEKATLTIDALTVLIGMNASGKSNLLEAPQALILAGLAAMARKKVNLVWHLDRGYEAVE